MQELLPEQKQRIGLAAGLKCHYKIPSLGQPIPLRIRLVTFKGVGACYLSISQTFERPTKEVSEQSVLIKSKELNLSFKGDRKERFNKAWIYFTFECEREFASNLFVGFGKVKLYKVGKSNSGAKASLMVKSDNEEKKPEFFRIEKILKSAASPSGFKSSMHSRTKTSEEVLRHRLQVKNLKEEREDEGMCNKILNINKKRINKLYDNIVQKMLKKKEHTKKSYMLWIVLSKLFKIARVLHLKRKAAKRSRKEAERRMHKLMRIYIFLKGSLSSIEPDLIKRVQHKLSTYFSKTNLSSIISLHNQTENQALSKSTKIVGWLLDEIDRRQSLNKHVKIYMQSSIKLLL